MERLVKLEADLAAKERRSDLTVGKKTSHPDPGLPEAAALKQSATAQRMTGRYNVEGRATVDHIKSPARIAARPGTRSETV